MSCWRTSFYTNLSSTCSLFSKFARPGGRCLSFRIRCSKLCSSNQSRLTAYRTNETVNIGPISIFSKTERVRSSIIFMNCYVDASEDEIASTVLCTLHAGLVNPASGSETSQRLAPDIIRLHRHGASWKWVLTSNLQLGWFLAVVRKSEQM